MKKIDKIKYIAFIFVLINTVIWYILDPRLSLSDLGNGWIATSIIIFVGVSVCSIMGITLGKRYFDNDPRVSLKELAFIKKFFKSAFITYFMWGTVQQALVFGIYHLVSIYTTDYNIIITSVIFAVMHFPNPVLLFATFGMSQVLMQHFEASNNILGAYIAHGLIASVLMFYLPDPLTTSWQTWRPFWNRQRALNLSAQIKRYRNK